MTSLTHDQQFQSDLTCYEQNSAQLRALNTIMWQVPIVLDFIEAYANAGVAILKNDEFDPRRPEIDLALLLLRAPNET